MSTGSEAHKPLLVGLDFSNTFNVAVLHGMENRTTYYGCLAVLIQGCCIVHLKQHMHQIILQ